MTNSAIALDDVSFTVLYSQPYMAELNDVNVSSRLTTNSTNNPEDGISDKVRLTRIILPIVIVVGVVGNSLSLAVMLRTSMRQTSTALYLAALAVADTLVLLAGALRQWLMVLPGRLDLAATNIVPCKLLPWVFYSATHTAGWLIVFMTIDRFFLIRYPLKMKRVSSGKIARVIISFTWVLFGLVNMHFLILGDIIVAPRAGGQTQTYCFPSSEAGQQFYTDVFPWIDAALYNYLPFVLLVIFNGLLVATLCSADRNSHRLSESSTLGSALSSRSTTDQTRRVSVLMLIVCFVYLLTTTPTGLIWLFYTRLQLEDTLVSFVVDFLMYINNSCNFFVYCATGTRFREELGRMCCAKCGESRPPGGQMQTAAGTSSITLSTISTGISTSTVQLAVYN